MPYQLRGELHLRMGELTKNTLTLTLTLTLTGDRLRRDSTSNQLVSRLLYLLKAIFLFAELFAPVRIVILNCLVASG